MRHASDGLWLGYRKLSKLEIDLPSTQHAQIDDGTTQSNRYRCLKVYVGESDQGYGRGKMVTEGAGLLSQELTWPGPGKPPAGQRPAARRPVDGRGKRRTVVVGRNGSDRTSVVRWAMRLVVSQWDCPSNDNARPKPVVADRRLGLWCG